MASPVEIARRRTAARVRDGLLGLVLLVHVGAGVKRALTPVERGPPPPPLAIDVAADPLERLVLLPGIGPTRAAAILDDRRKLGPVPSLDALVRVRGIGPVTIERLTNAREVRVVVSSPPLLEEGKEGR